MQFLPAQLPADLPVRLPIEAQDRILGSLVYQVGGKPAGWDIVLNVDRTVAQIMAAYERGLEEQNWRLRTLGSACRGRGFATTPPIAPADGSAFGVAGDVPDPSGPATAYIKQQIKEQLARQLARRANSQMFCALDGDASLVVTATPRFASPTTVHVQIDNRNNGPCQAEDRLEQGMAGRLPTLTPPLGVTISPGGGGGSATEWTSRAQALTELSAADLETHYAAQLEAAGWMRSAGAATEPLAWSTWTVPGDPQGEGYLYVIAKPGTLRRDLLVEIKAAARPAPEPARS